MIDAYDMDTKEGMLNCIKWQSNLVNLLGEGGIWAVPRSLARYRIFKSMHIAVIDSPDRDMAVERVFREMGWEVRHEL